MQVNDRELEYQALRQFLKAMEGSKTNLASNLAIALEDELTEKQKQVVQLYYIRQMPMSDIAEEMGVHVSTVSRTLKRARLRLRRCLKYGGQALLDAESDL